MLLITKLINTNITMVSQILHSKNYENHKTSFKHRSHLTALDLSKHYWKLVDNGAVPTIKFSVAKCVKAFIIRNLDDANILNKRSEFISKC